MLARRLLVGLVGIAIIVGFTVELEAEVVGTLHGWGRNDIGGIDPTSVPSVGNFTSVDSGLLFGMALKTDGSIVAWGSDPKPYGLISNVPTGLGFTAIAAGNYHGLAIQSDGALVAWGSDT
ncbi:unnamed protein product, partial [marine sediment metagenome]